MRFGIKWTRNGDKLSTVIEGDDYTFDTPEQAHIKCAELHETNNPAWKNGIFRPFGYGVRLS